MQRPLLHLLQLFECLYFALDVIKKHVRLRPHILLIVRGLKDPLNVFICKNFIYYLIYFEPFNLLFNCSRFNK